MEEIEEDEEDNHMEEEELVEPEQEYDSEAPEQVQVEQVDPQEEEQVAPQQEDQVEPFEATGQVEMEKVVIIIENLNQLKLILSGTSSNVEWGYQDGNAGSAPKEAPAS